MIATITTLPGEGVDKSYPESRYDDWTDFATDLIQKDWDERHRECRREEHFLPDGTIVKVLFDLRGNVWQIVTLEQN